MLLSSPIATEISVSSLYHREARHGCVYVIQSRKNNRSSKCCTDGQRCSLLLPTLGTASLLPCLRDALGSSNHKIVWQIKETQSEVHVLVLWRVTRWREEATVRSSMRQCTPTVQQESTCFFRIESVRSLVIKVLSLMLSIDLGCYPVKSGS